MRSFFVGLVVFLLVVAVGGDPGGLRADEGDGDAVAEDDGGAEGDDGAEAADDQDGGGGDAEAADDEDEGDGEPRAVLHKIYVPYRNLQEIFRREGEGVFIPQAEFEVLWRKARGGEGRTTDAPVDATIRTARYEGEAEGNLLRLEGVLEVEVLSPGWHRLPLGLGGVGIDRAALDGEGAVLVATDDGYELLLRGEGRRRLELGLRIAARREGDTAIAAFRLPAVPVTRLLLSLPGERTDVDLQPQVAYAARPTGDGRTRIEATLGAIRDLQVRWRTRSDEIETVDALLFAHEAHDVRIDRGVVRSETSAALSILRAPLERLEVTVPADAVVLYVQGDGIRTWTRSDDGTRIAVELREPTRERWALRVGLERALPGLPAQITLPVAALEGVERETGVLRLLQGEGVKVEAREMPGLLQIDPVELPEGLREAPAGRVLAYRFPARPGPLRVAVDALVPRVRAAVGTRVVIRPEGTEVHLAAALQVERAGIFGVEVDLPPEIEITAVRVQGVPYDDHTIREDEDGGRVLSVDFRDRLLGAGRLEIDGRRSTPLPAEEGGEREVELAVPLPRLRGVDHERGYLAVHVDASLEHRAVRREGLTALDASAPVALEPPGAPQGVPLSQRFEHHEGPAGLVLATRRKDPVVEASIESAVRLEPNRSRLETTLRYRILYRAVDTLRFTTPQRLAGKLHLDMEGVRLLGPAPLDPGEDGPDARLTWTLRLDPPRQGDLPVTLQIDDLEHEPLSTGESLRIPMPSFVPVEAGGEPLPGVTHHLAIRRDPLLEVMPEQLAKIEEIDARELPAPLKSEENFLAFRAYDPAWSLVIGVLRHDYEHVAEVVVTHLHLDTVVAAEGRATTEAWLVVRNNDRQYLTLRIPAGATIRAVTVDGRARTPRQAEDEDAILIPLLAGLGKDESFVVALAYDHEVDWSGAGFRTLTLESPRAEAVSADLLTWRVWVPENRLWTGFGGDLDPVESDRSWFADLVDGLARMLGQRVPSSYRPPAAVAGGFESPFATRHEGRSYLFTNRTGEGSLVLRSTSPLLAGLLFVLFFAIALVGARVAAGAVRRVGGRATWVYAPAVLVLLLLLVGAGPGFARGLNAALLGVAAAAAYAFLEAAVHAARRRREIRAAAKAEAETETGAQEAEDADGGSEGPAGADDDASGSGGDADGDADGADREGGAS